MTTFIIVLLILISLWLIFSPYIKPWLRRRAERKLADFIRAQMGMPTEKETKRAAKAQNRATPPRGKKSFWSRPGKPQESAQHAPKEIIPREYAVDVEFTEIRQFSQTSIAAEAADGTSFIIENQVSDVEYTEIKFKDAK